MGIRANDVMYGRISPYIPPHKTRKLANAVFVVSYWLPSWKPSYTSAEKWLSYESGDVFYRIYNPQKFRFNLTQLQNYIVAHHAKCNEPSPKNFRIMSKSDFSKWGT